MTEAPAVSGAVRLPLAAEDDTTVTLLLTDETVQAEVEGALWDMDRVRLLVGLGGAGVPRWAAGALLAEQGLALGLPVPEVSRAVLCCADLTTTQWAQFRGLTAAARLRPMLARCIFTEIRALVAKCLHPASDPQALFDLLAGDAAVGVRRELAENPAIPECTAQALVEDPSMEVRQTLATFSPYPQVVHAAMMSLDEDALYDAARLREDVPECAWGFLATHKAASVRYVVAQHPTTPVAILELLLRGPSPVTRSTAAQRLGVDAPPFENEA